MRDECIVATPQEGYDGELCQMRGGCIVGTPQEGYDGELCQMHGGCIVGTPQEGYTCLLSSFLRILEIFLIVRKA